MKRHPLSEAFPDMTPDEYQELKDSIELIGVQNPVVVHDEMIIDGWHRFCAAMDLGINPPIVELGENVDPKDYVLAQNLARRNLDASQRAAAVSAVYGWTRVGRPTNKSAPQEPISKTNAELAGLAGVGIETIKRAKKVEEKAAPAVKQAVRDGKIGLVKAAAIADLPKSKQAAAIDKPLPKKPLKAEETPEAPVDAGPDDEELRAQAIAEKADLEAFQKLLDADDKLATAYAEIKRLNAELAVVKVARDGYMDGKAELSKLLKRANSKIDRLEKQMREFGHGIAA